MRRTHISGRGAWLNVIDGYSARRQIDGCATNEPRKRSFRHAVDTSTGECGTDGGVATDYDDSPAIVHFLGCRLNADECATNIDGDHPIEVVDAKGINCAASKNASIANENVQPAQ